jgi:hypothetical protein
MTGGKFLSCGDFGTDEDGYVARCSASELTKPMPTHYILFDGDVFRYVTATGKNLLLHRTIVNSIFKEVYSSATVTKLTTLTPDETDFLFTYVKHPSEFYASQTAANPAAEMFGQLNEAPSFFTPESLTTDSLSKLLDSLQKSQKTAKVYCWTLGIKGLTINKEPECTATAATPY